VPLPFTAAHRGEKGIILVSWRRRLAAAVKATALQLFKQARIDEHEIELKFLSNNGMNSIRASFKTS
jgi:hypothetical protein